MNILILFAHPRFEASVVQKELLAAISELEGIDVRDLYSLYPDFAIDVEAEKSALLSHDLVVFQHPFYWYSIPAVMKEWLDLVLEFNWAYGPNGTALRGKFMMNAVSTGGDAEAYAPQGRNRFSLEHLLSPLNQTAHLCGMGWLRPFIVYSGRRMPRSDRLAVIESYRALLQDLRDGRIDPLSLLADGDVDPIALTTDGVGR
jgi:glutathione-regulated potassium-efflux system ancillary protein KefG